MESSTCHRTSRLLGLPIPLWLLVLACVAIIAYWSGHQFHVFAALPFLILAACPLMHLMHGGHGHRREEHEGHGGYDRDSAPPTTPKGH